ncbi:MAG: hypothetical protein ABJB34_04345, partial [Acidobacteriota bacterium]
MNIISSLLTQRAGVLQRAKFVSLCAFIAILLFFPGASHTRAQTTPITRQETLRGTITPERDWWDVLHYDLAV